MQIDDNDLPDSKNELLKDNECGDVGKETGNTGMYLHISLNTF